MSHTVTNLLGLVHEGNSNLTLKSFGGMGEGKGRVKKGKGEGKGGVNGR